MTTIDTRRASHSFTSKFEREPNLNPFLERLTPREVEVLARLRQGKSNKIIARELEISESAVKVFVRRLLMKLHALNRTKVASQIVQREPTDDAGDAFEAIVLDLVDEGGKTKVAADVLLDLIHHEADALEATMRDEIEDSVLSNARIEQLLNKAADHQAGTDEWLSRLP
jgi:DNA-binding CsgD family transcriptional regulator